MQVFEGETIQYVAALTISTLQQYRYQKFQNIDWEYCLMSQSIVTTPTNAHIPMLRHPQESLQLSRSNKDAATLGQRISTFDEPKPRNIFPATSLGKSYCRAIPHKAIPYATWANGKSKFCWGLSYYIPTFFPIKHQATNSILRNYFCLLMQFTTSNLYGEHK